MELPKQPIASRLLSWCVDTRDSIEQISTGFGVPAELVRSVLFDDSTTISETDAALLCRGLRLDPDHLWPSVEFDRTLDWIPSDGGYEPWPLLRDLMAVT